MLRKHFEYSGLDGGVLDALSAPAVGVVSDCSGVHPQLTRNRRTFPPQKSLLSKRFQKLSVSGWTLANSGRPCRLSERHEKYLRPRRNWTPSSLRIRCTASVTSASSRRHCQLIPPLYARCVGGAAARVGRCFARLLWCSRSNRVGPQKGAPGPLS